MKLPVPLRSKESQKGQFITEQYLRIMNTKQHSGEILQVAAHGGYYNCAHYAFGTNNLRAIEIQWSVNGGGPAGQVHRDKLKCGNLMAAVTTVTGLVAGNLATATIAVGCKGDSPHFVRKAGGSWMGVVGSSGGKKQPLPASVTGTRITQYKDGNKTQKDIYGVQGFLV